jgi:hypothetical protein
MDSSGLNPSWYCSKCVIDYPDKTETKSESYLSTPQKSNDSNPLASTAFKEPTVGREPIEYKGGFSQLAKQGRRITYYHDEEGTRTG